MILKSTSIVQAVSEINLHERDDNKLLNMVFSTTMMQLIPDKIQSIDPLRKSCKSATYECLLQEIFY